ncbi:MAG TPA: hypothetical protein PLA94_17970, partial [Myxococcota bacterium]|nr:hypothetical protein [Myxococcota bacterium]
AVQAGEDELALLHSDGEAFFEKRVRDRVESYGKEADTQLEDLSVKMGKALEGSADSAKESEKSDRDGREKKCWAGIDYFWGTDEEKLMDGVAGLTKVQGHALQWVYQRQHSSTLYADIVDDTSGSLKTSLLAWIEGNQEVAVTEALNYASSEAYLGLGTDAATAEIALRGASQQTRDALANDESFKEAKTRLLDRLGDDVGGTYRTPSYDAIAVLTDTSQSKESAERMADGIRMWEAMEGPGTTEDKVYEILGKRDAAGNQKLSEDYARYVFMREQRTSGGTQRWEDLPEETRRQYSQSTLANDIAGDFSRAEEDRAVALLAGNKGAAISAQLEWAATGSNDVDAAREAMKSLNEGRGSWTTTTNAQGEVEGSGDWLASAGYAERRAEFMDATAGYQASLGYDEQRERIRSRPNRAGRAEVAKNWETNRQATRSHIAQEFGDGTVTQDTNASRSAEGGYDNTDESIERSLLDSFETGRSDARDLMNMGVRGSGTREKQVEAALDAILAENDFGLRLQRLEELGVFCWSFFETEVVPHERHIQGTREKWVEWSAGQLPQLPAYLNDAAGPGADIGKAVQGIILVLRWETVPDPCHGLSGNVGGTYLDWILKVVQASARTNNANDALALGTARARAQLTGDGDLEDWDDETAATAFINQTDADAEAMFAAQAGKTEAERMEANQGRRISSDDQLRCHYRILKNLYEVGKVAGHFDATTGWVKVPQGKTEPEGAAKAWWTGFSRVCDRVDRAREVAKEHDEQLVNAITAIVAVVAAIAIAVVSLGSATWASAGLLSAAIT